LITATLACRRPVDKGEAGLSAPLVNDGDGLPPPRSDDGAALPIQKVLDRLEREDRERAASRVPPRLPEQAAAGAGEALEEKSSASLKAPETAPEGADADTFEAVAEAPDEPLPETPSGTDAPVDSDSEAGTDDSWDPESEPAFSFSAPADTSDEPDWDPIPAPPPRYDAAPDPFADIDWDETPEPEPREEASSDAPWGAGAIAFAEADSAEGAPEANLETNAGPSPERVASTVAEAQPIAGSWPAPESEPDPALIHSRRPCPRWRLQATPGRRRSQIRFQRRKLRPIPIQCRSQWRSLPRRL
jgi:hypothetical protein